MVRGIMAYKHTKAGRAEARAREQYERSQRFLVESLNRANLGVDHCDVFPGERRDAFINFGTRECVKAIEKFCRALCAQKEGAS